MRIFQIFKTSHGQAFSFMPATNQPAPPAQFKRWAGYIISGFPALFIVVDGIIKLFNPALALDAAAHLGYEKNTILPLEILLLACLAIYLIPRTAVLGAILLTAYLGGAVASHVRAGSGWVEILFPAFFGVLPWLGIYLRDGRLHALAPWRS